MIETTMGRTSLYAYLTIALFTGGVTFIALSPTDNGYRALFLILGAVLWVLALYLGFVAWRRIPSEEMGQGAPPDPITGLFQRIKWRLCRKNKNQH